MSPHRICSIAFTRYSGDGRVRRACEALAARGDRVTAITLAEAGRPETETIEGVEIQRIDLERLSLTTRQTRGRYLLEYGRFAVEAARRLVELHRSRSLDLVHVNNMPDALVVAALPIKALGVPVLLDVHDLMPDLYVNKFGGRQDGLVTRALVAQTAASAALADAVLTVTDDAKAYLESYGVPGERIHVVLNASDERHFPWRGFKEPGEAFVLGYHGTLSRRHGLDVALRALAEARSRIDTPLRFKIVGHGDAVAELEALVAELGLEDVVDLTPHFVPVETLRGVLSDVDLGLVPYRRDPATDLMLACKLFDYGNVGIPTISSRLRCISHYFDDAHVAWVEPADVSALADAIVAQATDPEARRARVARMHERVTELAWPTQRRVYLDLVDALVADRGRRPLGRSLAASASATILNLARPVAPPPYGA